MSEIKWESLLLLRDWADTLDSILQDARDAIEEDDSDGRIGCQNLLKEFIKQSPAKCDSLDAIAKKAVDDLFDSQVESSLKAIDSRIAELKNATGLIEHVTDEANSSARAIQFKRTIEVLDKAAAAVDAMRKLEQKLSDPNQELIDKIDAANQAIKDLMKLGKKIKVD